jgi:acetylornithine deacetylase
VATTSDLNEETVQLLKDLVRIPSVNPRESPQPAERDIAEFVANWMRAIGCEVALQEVLPGRPNVVARLKGRTEHRALLLEAHLDTVEVEGMVVEPFEGQVRDGRLYGRGSADAKGSLAAFMLAMKRLACAGVAPTVVFGPGTIRDAHRPDESVDLAQVQVAVEAITHLLGDFGGQA